LRVEVLEDRSLLASGVALVDVDAGQVVRRIDDPFLGVNVAWWDFYLNTSQTREMVQEAGLGLFRMPGGATSDEFHFDDPPRDHITYKDKSAAEMATFIASVNGDAVVTLDYGSGSPQEAAAFLAYLNAPTTSTTAIGSGQEWNDANGWVTKDWKTAGYWAALRAATPLADDDGLNFLRIGRSAPFGFGYFEVGNEVYGSWEIDHHGEGGDPGQAHDPATYVAFAGQFAGYAQQIDPTISIGLDTGAVDTWTSSVLQQCVGQGFTPGFLSDHSYAQEPGSENDATLLLHTVSDPTNTSLAWTNRAAGYRNLLQQTLGDAAAGVELLATEFNSVNPSPGKQTTSLVNGLFTADSLGSLLQAGYAGGVFWDLRNDFVTGNNNSASLYGWRQGGDYGLLGNNGPSPSTGPYVPYPTYFAEQLVSKMVHSGDTMVQAQSNDPDLGVYAVRQGNGHLDLLVLNKNATADLTATFQVLGFQAVAQAQVWQYGKAQDDAQSRTQDGHSALVSFVTNLSLSGPNFTETFPSYSMTVVDLAPVETPNVAEVSPAAGPAAGGTTVTITGTNLAKATKVFFGSKAAKIKSRADTQVMVVSPAGKAGTVHVTVVTAKGTSATSAADQFTYIAAPTVAAVSPKVGPLAGGTAVTITGTHLADATAVMFGKVVVGTLAGNIDTQIEVVAPAGVKAGKVDIRVVTPGGTSRVSAADKFTYIAAPTVTKISPAAGPTAGGTKVKISGKNLAKTTSVIFGAAVAATITRNTATQIVAVSPPGLAGTVDVTVVTAGGTSAASAADQFAYVEAPTVTGVDPSVGPLKGGTQVTITGTNLIGATKVFFGKKAIFKFASKTDTQIVLTSPPGKAGTVDIRVVTAGGTSAVTSNDKFTYVASSTIAGLSSRRVRARTLRAVRCLECEHVRRHLDVSRQLADVAPVQRTLAFEHVGNG